MEVKEESPEDVEMKLESDESCGAGDDTDYSDENDVKQENEERSISEANSDAEGRHEELVSGDETDYSN